MEQKIVLGILLFIIIVIILVYCIIFSTADKQKDQLTDKEILVRRAEKNRLPYSDTVLPPSVFEKYVYSPRDGTNGGQTTQYRPTALDDSNKYYNGTIPLFSTSVLSGQTLGVEIGNGMPIPEPDVSNPDKKRLSVLRKEKMSELNNTVESKFNVNAANHLAHVGLQNEEYIDGFSGLPDSNLSDRSNAQSIKPVRTLNHPLYRPIEYQSDGLAGSQTDQYTSKEYNIYSPVIY